MIGVPIIECGAFYIRFCAKSRHHNGPVRTTGTGAVAEGPLSAARHPIADSLQTAQQRPSMLRRLYDRLPPKSGHLHYRKTPTTGEVDGALERRVANLVPSLILGRCYLIELYKMDSRVTSQFRS